MDKLKIKIRFLLGPFIEIYNRTFYNEYTYSCKSCNNNDGVDGVVRAFKGRTINEINDVLIEDSKTFGLDRPYLAKLQRL